MHKVQKVFRPRRAGKKTAHLPPGLLVQVADLGQERVDCGCPQRPKEGQQASFLVMSSEGAGAVLRARLLLRWQHDRVSAPGAASNLQTFKTTARRFNKVDCSTLGREIRESVFRKAFD